LVPESSRELIVYAIATGVPRKEIRDSFGLTPAGLRGLLDTEDMQARLRSVTSDLEKEASLARNAAVFAWPEIVKQWVGLALVPGKQQLSAITTLADRLWPAKQVTEIDANLSVSGEVMTALAEALQSATAARTVNVKPRLLRGEAALTRADSLISDPGFQNETLSPAEPGVDPAPA
jgi:hypothetical protein